MVNIATNPKIMCYQNGKLDKSNRIIRKTCSSNRIVLVKIHFQNDSKILGFKKWLLKIRFFFCFCNGKYVIKCPFLISSKICTSVWMPNPNSNTKWTLISMLTLSNGFLVVGILLSKGGNDVISYRNHGTSHNLFKFSFISLSSNPYYFLFRFLGF